MDASIAPVAGIMAVSTRLFRTALDGADPEALRWRPFPGANPMHWIAGHATVVRAQLATGLGRPHPLAWADCFARGGTNDGEDRWPEIGAIVSEWDAISHALKDRLAELTAGELAASTDGRPSFDGTLRGSIQLVAFHDAHHIGQLGLLRRQSDLPRLVG